MYINKIILFYLYNIKQTAVYSIRNTIFYSFLYVVRKKNITRYIVC